MMIWVILAAVAGATALLVAWPVLRGRAAAAPDRAAYDLAVYRDQLREVDADVERGLLSAAQAEAARTEIKRRMLAAADQAGRAGSAGAGHRLAVAGAVSLLLLAGGFGLYGLIGRPSLPDQPYAARNLQDEGAHAQLAEMAGMIDRLAERLRETPDDRDGWIMLARSAKALERYGQAVDAYRRALALGAADPELHAGLGEALIFANDGEIGPEAVAAFENALRGMPDEPRSRFYLGMAHFQQGDARTAIAQWRDLERLAPSDAPWLDGLRARIAEVGKEAGIDPATVAPKGPEVAGTAPAAPSPGTAGMSADQQAMVQGMIDNLAARLKDNPDDAEGWQRLGRAYRVQEKLGQAKEAYGRAIALKPQDVDLKLAYADVLLAMLPADAKTFPPEVATVLREVLAIDAGNPDALYYLGLFEAQSGRKAEAKALWSRLRDQLPANSPERAGLQQQIDSLGG